MRTSKLQKRMLIKIAKIKPTINRFSQNKNRFPKDSNQSPKQSILNQRVKAW